MKKRIFLTISFIILFLLVVFPTKVYANDTITLVIDCHEVATDTEPIIQNGRTLVPLRFVAEELGFDVGWNDEHRKAKITDDNTSIELQINNTLAIINKDDIPSTEILDVPPILYNNRTMVPVRFISEIMGYKVDWNDEFKTVLIYTGIRDCTYEPPTPIPDPNLDLHRSNGNITKETIDFISKIDLDKTNYILTGNYILNGVKTTTQITKTSKTHQIKGWEKGEYIGVLDCNINSQNCTLTDGATNQKTTIPTKDTKLTQDLAKGKELLENAQLLIAIATLETDIFPNKAFSVEGKDNQKITILVTYDSVNQKINAIDLYLQNTTAVYQLHIKN